jgi:hypothetical protein
VSESDLTVGFPSGVKRNDQQIGPGRCLFAKHPGFKEGPDQHKCVVKNIAAYSFVNGVEYQDNVLWCYLNRFRKQSQIGYQIPDDNIESQLL